MEHVCWDKCKKSPLWSGSLTAKNDASHARAVGQLHSAARGATSITYSCQAGVSFSRSQVGVTRNIACRSVPVTSPQVRARSRSVSAQSKHSAVLLLAAKAIHDARPMCRSGCQHYTQDLALESTLLAMAAPLTHAKTCPQSSATWAESLPTLLHAQCHAWAHPSKGCRPAQLGRCKGVGLCRPADKAMREQPAQRVLCLDGRGPFSSQQTAAEAGGSPNLASSLLVPGWFLSSPANKA